MRFWIPDRAKQFVLKSLGRGLEEPTRPVGATLAIDRTLVCLFTYVYLSETVVPRWWLRLERSPCEAKAALGSPLVPMPVFEISFQ